MKRAAAERGAVQPETGDGRARRSPSAAVFGSLNQPGLSWVDNEPSDIVPPDATGAVGPGHYVEMVNSVVGVFSRTSLTELGTMTLEEFAGDVALAACDPQIQWDEQAGRWSYVILDCDGGPPDRLFLGWSKTSDPSDLSDGWCRYQLPTAGLYDYPKLGHNDIHWVIAANRFVGPAFTGPVAVTIEKPAKGATTCPADPTAHEFDDSDFGSDPDGDGWFTLVPTNTLASTPRAYLVAADDPFVEGDGTGEFLGIWSFSGGGGGSPPSLASDGTVTVAEFGIPPNVPQPGTTDPDDKLDTLDGRLTQAVAGISPAVGRLTLWTQHTIDDGAGASDVRWYELSPEVSPRLRQQGAVSAAGGLFAFNGAISPTAGGGSAIINYNVGGATGVTQIRASSRRADTPSGAMEGEITLGGSADVSVDFSCPSNDPTSPSCRWGDYAGASPDPTTCTLVWGSNQLVIEANPDPADHSSWGTRNFALAVGPNLAPSAGISGPTTLGAGSSATFLSAGTDPDGCPVANEWDLDGDGGFDDATGSSASRSFPTPGIATIGLRVLDRDGAAATALQSVRVTPRATCAGRNATIVGDGADNVLVGTPGPDVIVAGAGDDQVNGGGGNDLVCGGSGNDVVIGGSGGDRILGQGGNDRLAGGTGNDRLNGGRGSDRLSGNRGRDLIVGGSGRDRLSGNQHRDRLLGNRGNDRLAGGTGNDRLGGGSGRDRVDGDSGNDLLRGNSGNDRLLGDSGRDRLLGGSGSDRLFGGSGSDRLFGGSGRDRLLGGSGSDRLFGGSGSDRLLGGSGRDRLFGGGGRDRLAGGTGRDRLSGGPGRDRVRQ